MTSPRLCRCCRTRRATHRTLCDHCNILGVRAVHPAPEPGTYRVVPWDSEEPTHGTGGRAAIEGAE